jgi:diacylglycerol kinase (ATP)
VSRTDLVRTFPRLYRGTHRRHPAYEHQRVRSVGIATASLAAAGLVAYADGERLGPLPVTVDAVPQALDVLVPGPGSQGGRSSRRTGA